MKLSRQEILDLSNNPASLRFLAEMIAGDMMLPMDDKALRKLAKRREELLNAAARIEAEYA